MNPYHHALSSAEKYGGQAEDYLAIHQWFDESKAFLADFRHRVLRHHAEGIFLAERIFGATLTNSSGRVIPTRFIGEQHVKEDLGRIPTAQDWLARIAPQPWMMRASKVENTQVEPTLKPAAKNTVVNEESRWFRDHYECLACGHVWNDNWSATRIDNCPRCVAHDISSVPSEEVSDTPSGASRGSLTVGQLIAHLQRLAEQSPLGAETSVCVSRPDQDYDALSPPSLEQDPDGAVVLLKLACDGCGDSSGVRVDVDPGCSFEGEFPAGFVIIERCDPCDRFSDDLSAAKSVADHAYWTRCADGHKHAVGLPHARPETTDTNAAILPEKRSPTGPPITVKLQSEQFGAEDFVFDDLDQALLGIRRLYGECGKRTDQVQRQISVVVPPTIGGSP